MKSLRVALVNLLWQQFRQDSVQIPRIESALQCQSLPLDHFAIIDLPGPHSGKSTLIQLFEQLGFTLRGEDYLPEKQNPFAWLAAADIEQELATVALPQVVVADFRLDELPIEIRTIISHYSAQASPVPLIDLGDPFATLTRLGQYFRGRDWPAPTLHEFQTVKAFNELLAWVLVLGRRPNHFTLSVHLMKTFSSLTAFNDFMIDTVKLPLNIEGGIIKGNKEAGIAQSSTIGHPTTIQLADGVIQLPADFMEFVWRYSDKQQPTYWGDYFPNFIAAQANYVIESLQN